MNVSLEYLIDNVTSISATMATLTTAMPDSNDFSDLVAIIVPIFFGIIAITGFFGNSLVILVVISNPQMRSTTNLLIVNLAIADLLFVVFCIPFTATDYITPIWPFGGPWCKIVQYLIVVTAFASIYTLVLMSVDRFLAVVYPISSRTIRTERITKIAILTQWIVILIISLPVLFAHGIIVINEYDKTYVLCQFLENDFLNSSVYHIVFLSCSYLVPLLIISALYIIMISRLWRVGAGGTMSAESKRGRKRVTRLVIVVVTAFASLWFPVQMILVLKSLGMYQATTKFTVMLQIASQILAYFSSCINPVLYAFLSENFRKAFHKALKCCRPNTATERQFRLAVNCPARRRNEFKVIPTRPRGISESGRTSVTAM